MSNSSAGILPGRCASRILPPREDKYREDGLFGRKVCAPAFPGKETDLSFLVHRADGSTPADMALCAVGVTSIGLWDPCRSYSGVKDRDEAGMFMKINLLPVIDRLRNGQPGKQLTENKSVTKSHCSLCLEQKDTSKMKVYPGMLMKTKDRFGAFSG